MDFQAQVSARRAELEREAQEAKRIAADELMLRQAAEKAQRDDALDEIATDLSRHGPAVVREGDDLAIADPQLPPLDIGELRRTKISRLLKREARKLWTPGQNWQVIALIVSGVFLTTFYGLGLLLIAGGLLRGSSLNKRYVEEVRQRYPSIFQASDVAPVSRAV